MQQYRVVLLILRLAMLFCHSSYCTMCIIHTDFVSFTIPISPTLRNFHLLVCLSTSSEENQNLRSKTSTVIELHFFMKKKKNAENYVFPCFIPHVIFPCFHVLHCDVLKGQIEIETESEKFPHVRLYNAGPTMAIPVL